MSSVLRGRAEEEEAVVFAAAAAAQAACIAFRDILLCVCEYQGDMSRNRRALRVDQYLSGGPGELNRVR